ncbi:MAG: hypothetical protein LBL86_04120 [Coriobacteriales bacterium]|jgi:hypothetical protein|nr:hypothetical protein [Coriobacteriales bacterium]
MKTYTVTELKKDTATILAGTRNERISMITQNGKPKTLLLDITDLDLEKALIEARRYRSRCAIDAMREQSQLRGTKDLTMDEVDALIHSTRKARR